MHLNNKAMTLIEILVCFTLVGIISTMMLNTVLNYRTRQEMESVSMEIIKYKNNITKLVQDDIAKKHLKEVSEIETSTSDDGYYNVWKATLKFDDDSTKDLKVYQSNGTSVVRDKISYTDNKGKLVTYTLPDLGNYDPGTGDHLMKLRFGIGKEKATDEKQWIFVTRYVNEQVFVVNVPVFYHELGDKYHILIEAPIKQ